MLLHSLTVSLYMGPIQYPLSGEPNSTSVDGNEGLQMKIESQHLLHNDVYIGPKI